MLASAPDGRGSTMAAEAVSCEIEIPAVEEPADSPGDLMRDLQGTPKKDGAKELTPEEKAAAEIEKALGGGK